MRFILFELSNDLWSIYRLFSANDIVSCKTTRVTKDWLVSLSQFMNGLDYYLPMTGRILFGWQRIDLYYLSLHNLFDICFVIRPTIDLYNYINYLILFKP